jgi:hypothetical protein
MGLKQLQTHVYQMEHMKNRKIFNWMLFVVFTYILLSCGNSTKKIENDTTESILKSYAKKSQFFSINSDSSFSIVAKEGTKIIISSNSFVFEDGTFPKGKIDFELKECYSPSDIVFNNLSTQMVNDLLETGGMIFLEAKIENRILKLKTDKTIGIGFPMKDTAKIMNLYSASLQGKYMKWDNVIDSIEQPGTYDTVYSEGENIITYQKELNYYLFNSSQMGWLNCDKVLEGSDKTILTLNIDTTIIPNVRLIFSDLNSASFPLFDNGHMTFYNIPMGEKATLIGFYKVDEKTFVYKKSIIINSNMVETAVFKEVSLADLKREVDDIKW